MLYRLAGSWPASAQQLEAALAREPFVACGATQQKSVGWVAPRGDAHGALVEAVDGHWIACLAIETKTVPGEALRRKVQEAVEQIEQTSGRKPGKKELRDLRDDALLALLPQAFARRTQLRLWIDARQRRLLLDSASQARADEAIASLVRVAGSGFAISLLQTRISPQAAMSAWLASEHHDALPATLAVERECELKGSGEEPAVVKYARHELATDEVRQHIAEGKLPTRLALSWQARVGFVLTQALQLRKIGFLDGVLDDPAPGRAADERFDADLALSTGELAPLITDLVAALGGEVEPGLPSGFTDAPAPADAAHEESLTSADDPPF